MYKKHGFFIQICDVVLPANMNTKDPTPTDEKLTRFQRNPVAFIALTTLSVLFIVAPFLYYAGQQQARKNDERQDAQIIYLKAQVDQVKREKEISDSMWQVRFQTQAMVYQMRIDRKDSLIISLSMIKGAEIANRLKN